MTRDIRFAVSGRRLSVSSRGAGVSTPVGARRVLEHREIRLRVAPVRVEGAVRGVDRFNDGVDAALERGPVPPDIDQ